MLEGLIIVLILAVDQIVKFLSEANLTPLGTSFPIIEGVFQLTSAHNTGAAWGMLPGQRWMFLILTAVVCIFLLVVLIRFHNKLTLLARITLSLLFAGALGNAIDRVALGYVRDMFDFCLINFPIFNVADSALTVGCCLLIADVLFMKERSIFELRIGSKNSAPAAIEPVGDKAEDEQTPSQQTADDNGQNTATPHG